MVECLDCTGCTWDGVQCTLSLLSSLGTNVQRYFHRWPFAYISSFLIVCSSYCRTRIEPVEFFRPAISCFYLARPLQLRLLFMEYSAPKKRQVKHIVENASSRAWWIVAYKGIWENPTENCSSKIGENTSGAPSGSQDDVLGGKHTFHAMYANEENSSWIAFASSSRQLRFCYRGKCSSKLRAYIFANCAFLLWDCEAQASFKGNFFPNLGAWTLRSGRSNAEK